MQRGAVLHGAYRYTLWRAWDGRLPRALFVLLNPSTADANQDDPTLRRCIGFAKREFCGSVEIVNLFAYRTPQPALLKTIANPIGAENDLTIIAAARRANIIILGWGAHGTYLGRDHAVLQLLTAYPLSCLGVTKEGHPKHPLYHPYRPLVPWVWTHKSG